MQNADGIKAFKHDESWAKKSILKYLKHNKNDFSIKGVKKIFCPFYNCDVEGSVHIFEEIHVPTQHGGTKEYAEKDANLKINLMICDKQDINRDYLINMNPFSIKNFKYMDDYSEYKDAEFLDFSEMINEEGFQHAHELVSKDECYENNNKEIIMGLEKSVQSDFCMNCTSVTSYDMSNIKRYYYPMWKITTMNGEKEDVYYINDVNGKIGGHLENKGDKFYRWIAVFLSLVILSFIPFTLVLKIPSNLTWWILYAYLLGVVIISLAIAIPELKNMSKDLKKGKCFPVKVLYKRINSRKFYFQKKDYDYAIYYYLKDINEKNN